VTPSSVPLCASHMPNLSTAEHRDYLIQKIESCWKKYQQQYDLENHQLVELQDYELIIDTNSASICVRAE